MGEARLQKLLARAGVASRRAAEELIRAGRVTVNGRRITEMGVRADPAADEIRIDGRPLRPDAPPRVLAMHKPKAVLTTMHDPRGRKTVADLLPPGGERLFPVGRLDYHSEGLLLLTNDGDLAHRILHPRSGVAKTYQVKVRGNPSPSTLRKLARGVVLDGRRTLPCRARPLRLTRDGNAWIEVVLHEGRRNQIRRSFLQLGHPVQKLRRVRIGPVDLGSLPPGEVRELDAREIVRLHAAPGKTEPVPALRSGREPARPSAEDRVRTSAMRTRGAGKRPGARRPATGRKN